MGGRAVFRFLIMAAGWLLVSPSLFPQTPGDGAAAAAVTPSADTLFIRKIILTGNKITKPRIILSEMTFRAGDTLTVPALQAAMTASRQNVFNTKLFNFVTVDTTLVPGTRQADVHVAVVERWYIWPVPILEISDRNFTVWWQTKDLSRLTYGMDLTFNNVRGRNETLRMLLHFGYNQLYGFTYKVPNLNRKQTIGFAFGSGLELNHELSVSTIDNKPVYVKDTSGYMKKIAYGYTELQLRPSFYSFHYFRLSYNYYFFSGEIHEIPGFSLVNSARQQFVTFSYLFRNDHRDASFYPLTGHIIEAEFNHTMPYAYAHNTFIKANLRKYWQIWKRWYFASGVTGKATLAKTQPYFLQRGLGYGRDVVRGYEYYVIDGQQFLLLKSDLKFALVPQKVFRIPFIRTTKFNTIPLALYLNAFADLGYVYNGRHSDPGYQKQGNTLENSLLAGVGLGIDLTTYYDVVIRVEGALNRLGQTGIFLNFIAPI
jgi:outer membrane protein assembly factor BamA